VILARFLLFLPLPPALWAIPVLQELREQLAAATELVAEIGLRFKQGDAAEEQVALLESRLATLVPLASGTVELPPDLRAEITELLSRVQETVATGDDWLARTGPELATQHARQRLRRAYGVL
jgi:hypothetical protein